MWNQDPFAEPALPSRGLEDTSGVAAGLQASRKNDTVAGLPARPLPTPCRNGVLPLPTASADACLSAATSDLFGEDAVAPSADEFVCLQAARPLLSSAGLSQAGALLCRTVAFVEAAFSGPLAVHSPAGGLASRPGLSIRLSQHLPPLSFDLTLQRMPLRRHLGGAMIFLQPWVDSWHWRLPDGVDFHQTVLDLLARLPTRTGVAGQLC